jgi:hypothetical protein
MEFLIDCFSEDKKQTTKSRTNLLRKVCDCAGVQCIDWANGNPGDCLVVIDHPDSYTEILQTNIIVSFCCLYKYPLVRVPKSSVEEFLNKYHSS